MIYLDLFSGIGGFALGARMAGMKFGRHFYSEIDSHANRVYAKNFPQATALGDIRSINGSKLKGEYGDEWIITGGFPCQDISTAGRGVGLRGSRSILWYEMHRLIGELRPRFVIAENVGQLRNRGLDRVLSSLAEIGYAAEWQTISASSIGASHRRERIWIVAYPVGIGCNSPLQKHQGERDLGKVRTIDQQDEGLMSWADWQRTCSSGQVHGQPLACRVDDGVSAWVDRVKGLGNAIVPQIAAMLFARVRVLTEIEQGKENAISTKEFGEHRAEATAKAL